MSYFGSIDDVFCTMMSIVYMAVMIITPMYLGMLTVSRFKL